MSLLLTTPVVFVHRLLMKLLLLIQSTNFDCSESSLSRLFSHSRVSWYAWIFDCFSLYDLKTATVLLIA